MAKRESVVLRIIRWTLMSFGMVTLVLILTILAVLGFRQIAQAIEHPSLNQGIVVERFYDDGHVWYVDTTIGQYTIREKHGGRERFLIDVANSNGKTDTWEISERDWDNVQIGQAVTKDQFK